MKPWLVLLGAIFGVFTALNAPTAVQAGAFDRLKESAVNQISGEVELGTQSLVLQNKTHKESRVDLIQKYKLDAGGYLWTPKFLEIDGKMRFMSNAGQNGSLRSDLAGMSLSEYVLDEYALDTRLFPRHKLSFYAGTRKYQAASQRDFGRDYETNNVLHHFGWDLKAKTPIRFNWNRTGTDFDGRKRVNTDDLTFSIQSAGSMLEYGFVNWNESDDAFDSHYQRISFRNNIEWGEKKNLLNSNAAYSTRGGSIDRDDFSVTESLTLQHLPELKSRYLYNFNLISKDDYTIAYHRLRGEVEHKLYRNITTKIGLEGRLTDEPVKKEVRLLKAEADLNYRNRFYWSDKDNIPSPDRTYLFDLLVRYRISEEKSWQNFTVEGKATVINEKHRLRDEIPVELNQRRIDLDSLRVMDSKSLTLYQKGRDYQVTRDAAGRVYINRILSGFLPNDSEVEIDYNYTYFPLSIEVSQVFQEFNAVISRNLGGKPSSARAYLEYKSASGMKQLSGADKGNENSSVNSWAIGAAANVSQGLSFESEYSRYRQQRSDQYFYSYSKAAVSGKWQKEYKQNLILLRWASGLYLYEDRKDKSHHNVGAEIKSGFAGGTASIKGDYQRANGDLLEKGSEWKVRTQYDYPFRSWVLTFQYDWADIDFAQNQQEISRLYLGISRRFDWKRGY